MAGTYALIDIGGEQKKTNDFQYEQEKCYHIFCKKTYYTQQLKKNFSTSQNLRYASNFRNNCL